MSRLKDRALAIQNENVDGANSAERVGSLLCDMVDYMEAVAHDASGSDSAAIDSTLSSTSTNAVQNRVVTAALGGKQDVINDLSTIRSNAESAIRQIKTVNGISLVGSGNITIENSGSGGTTIAGATASVDNNTGTPSVEVSMSGGGSKLLSFAFKNLKGAQGDTGTAGTTPVISAVATVDNNVGTPSVTVTKSGTDVAPTFAFAFRNLKGVPGEGSQGSSLAADEEDITNSNGTLKFMNRGTTYGMGMIILRRDKTFGSQVKQSNTIYVIRYNFDLGESSVSMPANCVLKFEGGAVTGGTLVGRYTAIDAPKYRIFSGYMPMSGSWKIEGIYPEWFGAVADGSDSTAALQKAIDVSASIEGRVPVRLLCGTYGISSPLILPNSKRITIFGSDKNEGCVIKALSTMTGMIRCTVEDGDYMAVDFSNFTLDGNAASTSGLRTSSAKATCGLLIGKPNDNSSGCMIYSTLRDMFFKDIDGYAVSIAGWATTIDNCKFDFCENGIFGWSGNGLKVVNSVFNYTTEVGVTAGGYGVVIRDSIFDYSGHCAVIIGSESKATIDSNYFEGVSQNGMRLYDANTGGWYPSTNTVIYPVILGGTGAAVSGCRGDKYIVMGNYPSIITVTDNYLDSPEAGSTNKFFVFSYCITSGRITDNVCRDQNNTRTAFGMPSAANVSARQNVEVARNWNIYGQSTSATRALMPEFRQL